MTLLTKLICTPSRRCDPEHSRQQKAPIVDVPGGAPGGATIKDAHVGFFSGQSEHTWFSGRSIKILSLFFNAFWSDMVGIYLWCVTLGNKYGVVLLVVARTQQGYLTFSCQRLDLPRLYLLI